MSTRYFLSCRGETCSKGPLINSHIIGYNFDMAAGVDYEIDLTQPEAVQRYIDYAAAKHGRIDVLLNAAAIQPHMAAMATVERSASMSAWRKTADSRMAPMTIAAASAPGKRAA